MASILIRGPSDPARNQAGLSLIELMISIALGLVILAAVASLFVSQSKTRTDLDKANRLLENGRYALEVLSEDLRLAGFYGELDPSSVALPGAVPDPCATAAADLAAAVRLHVQGYDAATTALDIASPPCGLTSATLKTGSDILVVRRTSTAAPEAQAAAAAGAGTTAYLQASLCQHDATPYKIETVAANLTLRQRNCTTTSTTPYADVRPYFVHVYFISPNNNAGDGIPTLKRRELMANGAFSTVALVEGIEYMQIDYGIDHTSSNIPPAPDGVVDVWTSDPAAYAPGTLPTNCTAINANCIWSNVVAVKINLLARNTETTPGYVDNKQYDLGLTASASGLNDNYKRHVYSQVVRLANPAGRREATP